MSILFKSTLSWSWIVAQRGTTAQIFTYMPQLLAHATDDTEQDVQTVQLMRYEDPAAGPANDARVVYQAYMPSAKGRYLHDALSKNLSVFDDPTLNPVAQQLAATIDTSFDVLSLDMAPDPHTGLTPTARDALIGMLVGLGGLLVLGFAIVMLCRYREKRRRSSGPGLHRTDTINSFGNMTPPVHIADVAPVSQTGSYFVGDAAQPMSATSSFAARPVSISRIAVPASPLSRRAAPPPPVARGADRGVDGGKHRPGRPSEAWQRYLEHENLIPQVPLQECDHEKWGSEGDGLHAHGWQ